ncbi:SMI1/KNR4 family protein [Microbacterium sp. A204]|uniref:SMI1/KNR4 family protein n=1 Tax=Microbacterium sp. A204 TaxID=3457321 RepID=UPI003FD01BD5
MPGSNALIELAAEYGLAWPELYLRLADDGMLDWGTFGPDWASTQAPLLRERVPILFFDCDFEPLTCDGIREELDAMCDPEDYRKIDPAQGYLPFGRTPGGDLYCFEREAAGDRVGPVVLILHDDEMGEYLASSLQDFIATEMIMSFVEFDSDQFLGDGDPHANASLWLHSHRPYLRVDQISALELLYERSVAVDADRTMSIIEHADAEELVKHVAPFPKRGDEFVAWGEE